MSRRAATATRASTFASPTPYDARSRSPPNPQSPLGQLRRHWKWAAFSQFFYTFARLLAMEDVTLTDIEEDLTHSTAIVLPRIMQRLLYTLTQDKKSTMDNWQTVLRRQYLKRNPQANPLGLEPKKPSVQTPDPEYGASSRAASEYSTIPKIEANDDNVASAIAPSHNPTSEASASDRLKHDGTPHSSLGAPSSSALTEARNDTQSSISPEDEAKDWFDLPMLAKLDTMHLLAEWQFQNPLRLRTLMRNDDDGALWRVGPIGYDAKTNAYWLIGPDRLWIQRTPPKPPRTPKRKRAAAADVSSRKSKRAPSALKNDLSYEDKMESTSPAREAQGRTTRQHKQPSVVKKGERAAKQQANIKLDAQAKAFAEYQRQAAADSTKRSPAKRQKTERASQGAARLVGTRLSSRLRGSAAEAEWQPIPEEWLAESSNHALDRPTVGKKSPNPLHARVEADNRHGTGLESDSDATSELTALSDDQDVKDVKAQPKGKESQGGLTGDGTSAQLGQDQARADLPGNFVEWETICVTLDEWEHIAEQFQNSTHYSEKALYKRLIKDIVPPIISELREIEHKRRLEEAIVHRKRSSRIASKETAREEARLSARKKAEEEEKLARAKRLEARAKKEEEDRERRETAREQRRREREEKEKSGADDHSADPSAVTDQVVADQATSNSQSQRPRTLPSQGTYVVTNGIQAPGDDWELDCEVCHRRGINQDDGIPTMSCGMCSKWQHIRCHDELDRRAGRQRRNWEVEEFICQRCRSNRNAGSAQQQYPQMSSSKNVALQWQHPRSSTLVPSSVMPPGIQPTRMYGTGQAFPSANGHYPHTGQPVPSPTPQMHPFPSQAPITFAHYQPQQHGFSVGRTSTPSNHPPSYRSTYESYGNHQAAQFHQPAIQSQVPSTQWTPVPTQSNGYQPNSMRSAEQWPGHDQRVQYPSAQWRNPHAPHHTMNESVNPYNPQLPTH